MRPDSTQADGPVALVSAPAAVAAAGATEHAPIARVLGRWRKAALLPRVRVLTGPVAGHLALGGVVCGALLLVAFTSGRASVLVPRSPYGFPQWEAGPLHFLLGRPTASWNTLENALSVFIVAMTLAYGVALLAVRSLSMRMIAIVVVALHVILLMSPPMQLTDIFNYIGYARLGALHHLNPYTHGINAESHDPVYALSTWHNLHSPYGSLFTLATYPLGLLPLSVAYWIMKTAVVSLSLAFIWLVYQCARALGRDPRFAVLFVAANPIYLFYAVAGFHNDFFMLVPMMAAIVLLVGHRDRGAGALLMVAVAVKFTAILLLPFLLIAARPPARRPRVLAGAALAAVPLIALSLAAFGFTLPNLHDQSTLLTDFSIPNVVGLAIGAGGGTPGMLHLANLALVAVVLVALRRRGDWISGAGWATVALIASLAWLMPWYVIWALPLAAMGTSIRLRWATIALTLFLVITFMPAFSTYLADHGVDPLSTPAGQASHQLQVKLAG
jgi:Glycosyltransferase family 87